MEQLYTPGPNYKTKMTFFKEIEDNQLICLYLFFLRTYLCCLKIINLYMLN